jgi:hypothetical protein
MEIMNTIQGIKIINICDWDEEMYGDVPYWSDISWDKQIKDMKKWCAENDAVYYGAPKEDFFIWKGIDYAKAQGKSCVVVEDLS